MPKLQIEVNGSVNVKIPDLSRLIDYLERGDQAEVDKVTADVGNITDTLKPAESGLSEAVTSAQQSGT